MNLHKLARIYFIDTFFFYVYNLICKAKHTAKIFMISDFKKYFQPHHLISIINTLIALDIIICSLMHGNVNIVTTEKKVRTIIKNFRVYINLF